MKHISFKLIFRSWWRNKTFTVISILSLAVGIACVNLLAAFVVHEYNVEADNPNKDKIVAVKHTVMDNGPVKGHASLLLLASDVSSQLPDYVPELDKSCRVIHLINATYLKTGENFFSDIKVVESDSTFFQLFPQKVVMGSLEDALLGPDRIVLSEPFAQRLFGRNDPIGQTVQIAFGDFPLIPREGLFTFTVSAVVKENHQAMMSFDALFSDKPSLGLHFFSLKDNVSIPYLQSKTENLIFKNARGHEGKYDFVSIPEACLKPLEDRMGIKEPNTTLLLIAFLSAILILAIACFNYVNLSFSRVFKQLYSMHIQKLMGAESNGDIPVGHLIKDCEPEIKELYEFGEYVIAGVIEDYFYYQLESPIHKSFVHFSRDGAFLRVRIAPGATAETIRLINDEWNRLYPGRYLEHESVYARILGANKKVIGMSDLLMMYAIISLLLTCFGLFGMALYAIEQRTKEIGIRKVNGSTTWQIMRLLNRQFIIWIGIAFVIAVPVVRVLLNRWMENFAYRADFSIRTYILSLLIVVGITLLTVSRHSYRAASGNPVNALRNE